jgi:hypothetical protein
VRPTHAVSYTHVVRSARGHVRARVRICAGARACVCMCVYARVVRMLACVHLRARRCVHVLPRVEATSVWKWWNYCSAEASKSGNRVLTVNMDETALCLFQGASAGNLFIRKSERTMQSVPRSARRTFLTHAAFVCDDPEMQPLMPQVVLVNERTVNKRQWHSLQRACPPGVRLMRQKSAWVNSELCARMVRWLAAAVAPFADTTQVVFLFDAARQHVTPQVLRACAAVRVWPVVIPAGLTWLLQPLDTHVFALYKVRLQRSYHAARIAKVDGRIDVTDFLPCVYDAIKQTLDGQDWSYAFERDGFSPCQSGVGKRVLSELSTAAPIIVGSDRPSDDQLLACLPRRCKIDLRLFWKPLKSRLRASALAPFGVVLSPPPSPCVTMAAPMGVPEPIALRTRAGVLRVLPNGGSH